MKENSHEAVERELAEEYGWTVKEKKLKLFVENFFALDGRDFHEIGTYYLIDVEEPVKPVDGEFAGKEDGLVSKWIKLGELGRHNIVPGFLKDPAWIRNVLNTDAVRHVIVRG